MNPRATSHSIDQPEQRPAELIAELFMAMPIVLLASALYEAFVEPTIGGGPLLPSAQA